MSEEKKLKAKILIGVPMLIPSHEFYQSFIQLWTELITTKGPDIQVGFSFKHRRPVHLAECELAQEAVDTGCTHLLLMDDDIYDMHAHHLYSLLNADKDVIGGIMHAGGFPYAVCAFRRYDRSATVKSQPNLKTSLRLYEIPEEDRHGVQPADLIPFAFTLIKTKVFEHIEKPWFRCNETAPTDSFFADTIMEGNMEYFAHFDVWTNHKGITRENRGEWYQLGLKNSKTGQSAEKATVINLDPSIMKRHESYMRLEMVKAEERRKEDMINKINATFLNPCEVKCG